MPKPKNIRKASETKHVFLGIHSIPGVGKTRLIGTTCDIATKGVLILRPPTEHTASMRAEDQSRAEVWTLRDHDDLAEAGEFLAMEGGKHYDWVWFDSASLFTDHGLDQMWDDIVAAKPYRAQFGLDQGEYFHNMTRIMRWVRKFVSMDEFNFGWTAHSMEYTMGERTLMVPQIQVKNMWQKATGYTNLVAYLEKKETKTKEEKKIVRVLRTDESDDYFAKCQFHGAFADDRMVNPTMPKIMDAINAVRVKPRTTNAQRRTGGSAKAKLRARRANS